MSRSWFTCGVCCTPNINNNCTRLPTQCWDVSRFFDTRTKISCLPACLVVYMRCAIWFYAMLLLRGYSTPYKIYFKDCSFLDRESKPNVILLTSVLLLFEFIKIYLFTTPDWNNWQCHLSKTLWFRLCKTNFLGVNTIAYRPGLGH